MRVSGFKAQLMGLMGAVVVVLLAAIVSVMLYVARHYLYEVGAGEALARAQAYALKAAFPALVEDAKEVDLFLQHVVEAPQTLAAELLEPGGASAGVIEVKSGSRAACRFADHDFSGSARLVYYQVQHTWCLSVPVRASPGEQGESAGKIIGRLRIVSSQTSLLEVVNRLFFWGVAAGVLMMCLAVILLNRAARLVTNPLQRIVNVMRMASQGDTTARAEPRGPQECVTIATVYNDLMDQKERHAAEQEAKVEERTRQLYAATEAARAAEQSKSQFMRTAGHEMKTPLHVIEANARNVLGELEFIEGSAAARKGLEVVLKEAGELARRVSQILALARAEAGNYQPVRERFDLKSLAEDIREKAQPVANRNGNMLEVSVCEAQAYTDRDMALQICSNLAINGCKFTTNGKVCVALKGIQDVLQIEVTDTGRGIPAAQQASVWEEFRQVDMGEGRRFGGFGLGLAIVKRFTEALGGSVELTSEQGRGTSVKVRLPGVLLGVGAQDRNAGENL